MTPRSVQRIAVVGVGLLVLAGCASASPGRQAAPPRNPAASAVALAPPVRQVLPNGLRLIVQDHRASDIVAIYMIVGTGVRYEKSDQLGFAHFQEHMLFKGTDRFGPGYIDRFVEGTGGRSNALTSFDYTMYFLLMPADELESGLALLADMAFRSTFAPPEIDREREVIFEEAKIEQDNPRTAIVRQLYAIVFEGNPYGHPVLGTRPTLMRADQKLLRAFNAHYYTPENMTVVVVGPVAPAAVRTVVDRTFGRAPATGYVGAPAPAPAPLTGRAARTMERPEQQAFLALGWQAPRSDDPDGYAVDLLTSILAGSDSARLTRRLRDEEKLVSSITMNYAALMGGGIASLRAELEAKDLTRVEAIILEEIARMQESGPTEEERQLAVTRFEAQHAFDTETSEGLARAYAIAETTWTLDAELRYVDRLGQVTREQIREAARKYLSRANYAQLAFVPRKAGS